MSPSRVVVALLLLALLCRTGGASPPSISIAASLSVHRRLLQNPDLPSQRQPKTETTNSDSGSSSGPEDTADTQSSSPQQQQQQQETSPNAAGDQQASNEQREPSATSAESGEGAPAAGRIRGWLRERLASRWGRD